MDTQTKNGIGIGKNVFLIINQQITPLTKDVTRLGRQLDNDVVFKEEFDLPQPCRDPLRKRQIYPA